MERSAELGEFLRTRRARLAPAEVGLADFGGRRRVPGLRREELAQLAGVSAGYYTRLEQGHSPNASDAVLDAIARVLRLDPDERAHLYALARPARPAARRRPRPERLRPALRAMLTAVGDVPALVVGRSADVLAWNRMAHALLAAHLDFDAPDRPGDRPNIARLVFLDAHTRELYADWRAKARDTVADLRRAAARYPDDRELAALVGELTMKSRDFAALWSAHPVRACAHYVRELRHPTVGPLTLINETLELPDDDRQRLALFYAEPGTPDETGLRLLADPTGDRN
ncbi:helix-turn-helix transcriptional regulator [Actinomadura kijaniata]|uniref:Transcriptional regulator with XRE-family HTH domain n=1 Tax=Actinomadura namibiensis TaxID=182080 RepID=A0A7W3LLK2_ACTNM|nr:helix-turn-helix transcriptional regulator [Actinomadura namibiensis]MBA8950333.1 transcriptional regulator with XRE-family HTH domain [Actinomadura namibiensis]